MFCSNGTSTLWMMKNLYRTAYNIPKNKTKSTNKMEYEFLPFELEVKQIINRSSKEKSYCFTDSAGY
jgi:hypothetical protein